MIKYFLLFLLSGLTVVAISLLSEKGQVRIAGFLVFAPIVSLWSYSFIAAFQGAEKLHTVVYNTILSIPCIIAFVISLYFLIPHLGAGLSIVASLIIWVLVFFVIYGAIN